MEAKTLNHEKALKVLESELESQNPTVYRKRWKKRGFSYVSEAGEDRDFCQSFSLLHLQDLAECLAQSRGSIDISVEFTCASIKEEVKRAYNACFNSKKYLAKYCCF